MVTRRKIIRSLAVFPLAAALWPVRRAGADMLHEYTIATPGGRRATGILAMPAGVPAPAVVIAHDREGLDTHMRGTTAELARQGFLAVAPDMADDPGPEAALDILAGWVEWLGVHDASSRRIGVLGWGVGADRALALATHAPVAATVVYGGRVAPGMAAGFSGPFMGHFARRDSRIDHETVSAFAADMANNGKDCTIHWYDADRGFANPTAGGYDSALAELAWSRSLSFFRKSLRRSGRTGDK